MIFNTSTNTFYEMEISLPRPVRFWLFLLLDIPSIYCSFILLFYFFIDKTLRSQLNNHIIITLLIIGLIIEFIDIPFHMSFLNTGVVQPSIPSFCLLWQFIDLGLINGCTIIMAWCSIHRYLSIYHGNLFSNKNKRFVFHYFPLIIITLYIWIFYIIVIIFPPCINTFDYTLPVCNNFPCYLNDALLSMCDSVINSLIPTMIITIFSVILLIRVYYQKRRLHQQNLWRRQRKMTIQLFVNCILYMIANIPLNFFIFANLFGLSNDIGIQAEIYLNFLCYCVILLFPFLCLNSLSELSKKISWKKMLLFQRPQQNLLVRPQ